jgi:hypothetical protein
LTESIPLIGISYTFRFAGNAYGERGMRAADANTAINDAKEFNIEDIKKLLAVQRR